MNRSGFRLIGAVRKGSVELLSRNLRPFTNLFRSIADALASIPTSLVLDGEVVWLDRNGWPDFEALQGRLRQDGFRRSGDLRYIVFDCLYLNGYSLLGRSLEVRKDILRAIAPAIVSDRLVINDTFPGAQGTRVFREVVRLGLEGVVAKRRQSVYQPGIRSRDWVKIPIRHREEFVVGGYVASRADRLSSIVVGQYGRDGRLAYTGLVGTGLSASLRRGILAQLRSLERKRCPFVPVPKLRDPFGELRNDVPPRWVKPQMVVEVEFPQRTPDGLRHAALKGVRPDKSPHEAKFL